MGGAPELPGDPGEEDLRAASQNIQHAPIPSSDDSEMENDAADAYNGYEPLAVEENGANERVMAYANDDDDDDFEMDDDMSEQPEACSQTDQQAAAADSDLPRIESVDAEIQRAVWNAPRPQELEIELDNTRREQILTAMSNFALPNVVVPEWVQEDSWKEDLLQRIRQRRADDDAKTTRPENKTV